MLGRGRAAFGKQLAEILPLLFGQLFHPVEIVLQMIEGLDIFGGPGRFDLGLETVELGIRGRRHLVDRDGGSWLNGPGLADSFAAAANCVFRAVWFKLSATCVSRSSKALSWPSVAISSADSSSNLAVDSRDADA